MRSLALGWRLARRSWRESIARTASMALGMVLTGFVAAAILGLPAVFDGKNARNEAVAVTYPDDGSAVATDSGVPLLGKSIEEQLPNGRLRRTLIGHTGTAASAPTTLPPGVTTLPRAGQVVMSPALVELAEVDPLVAQRFPQERIGIVADDGLVEPGQLVAYVGTEPDESFYAISFGATDVWQTVKDAEVQIAMIVAAAFLALPAAMFLATSTRLSARARDQRLASLRLLGLPRRAVRTVNAVETAVVAAIGAVAGCLLWAIVQYPLGRFGVGGFRWFAADAPVGIGTIVGIAALAAVAAVVVGTMTANDAIDEPLASERQGVATVRITWRAAVLVAGAGLLVAANLCDEVDTAFAIMLVLGGLTAAFGTTLATPVVSQALGAALGRRPSGTTRMLVARRLRHEPSAAGRILAGVLVATFALGVGQGVAGAFRDAGWDPSNDATLQIQSGIGADELTALPGVDSAIPQIPLDGDAAFVATCADVEAHLAQRLPTCVDGAPFALRYFDEPVAEGVPVVVAQWPEDSSSAIEGLVVPADAAADLPIQGWNVRVDPAERDAFAAALVGADPTAFAGNWPEDRELADMVSALVTAGAIAAFVIGLGAVVVATADRAVERRALDANLLAVGIPGAILRRAQLWTVSLPVAVTVTGAALVGTLAGHLYRQAGSDDPLHYPWGVAMTASGVGLAGAATAGLLAFALAKTQLRSGDLRSE